MMRTSIRLILDRAVTLLLSWPLLLSLAVLVVNDQYLKAVHPGWLSGKLSDVAGIFLVSFIAFGLFPRTRRFSATLVVLLFVFWKSPASGWLIETVNAVATSQIGRVVDYSDLLALFVIPVAWTAASRDYSVGSRRLQTKIIAAVERVTDKYELECEICEASAGEDHYFNDDMRFWFKIDEASNGIQFRISVTKMRGFILAKPDYELFERFRRDLKVEIGNLSPGMEYVERLSGPPFNY